MHGEQLKGGRKLNYRSFLTANFADARWDLQSKAVTVLGNEIASSRTAPAGTYNINVCEEAPHDCVFPNGVVHWHSSHV